MEELGEAGYGGFTIESVAARAGVGKSTVYRHWRDKLSLIADALMTLHQESDPDIVTGSPRERIVRIVRHVAEIVSDSIFSDLLPGLIDGAERDAGLRKLHHLFQREAGRASIAIIKEGIDAGDFPPHLDPELAHHALIGVLFYRRLMWDQPFDPMRARELVDTVLGPEDASR